MHRTPGIHLPLSPIDCDFEIHAYWPEVVLFKPIGLVSPKWTKMMRMPPVYETRARSAPYNMSLLILVIYRFHSSSILSFLLLQMLLRDFVEYLHRPSGGFCGRLRCHSYFVIVSRYCLCTIALVQFLYRELSWSSRAIRGPCFEPIHCPLCAISIVLWSKCRRRLWPYFSRTILSCWR